MKNWSFVIQSFEFLGRIFQLDHDYENAVIAYKKMLQLAWLTNSYDYEIMAYSNLAKQNFYLQCPKKSKIYAMRALNGLVEPSDSRSREIGIDMVLKQYGPNDKVYLDKYERLGFEVNYKHPKQGGDIKIIDYTQEYKEGLDLVKSFGEMEDIQDLPELQFMEKLNELCSHKIGRILIEVHPTVSAAQQNEVQSPIQGNRKSPSKLPRVKKTKK